VNFRQALRDLDGRQPEVMPEPSLDRIAALAELLDHPEVTYPSIHVTGTNGKTTTARLVTALACAHGLTTGTFVSPHLESVTERLSVCGDPIMESDFAEEYERLHPYLESVDAFGRRLTYFETLTGLAYLWFADKPVSLGVFEVGMGGKWDATNLIRGDVAVLCPIGLDHKELGSTVAEVAEEKAGIIKEQRIAVVREQRPEAREVVERRAREVEATLLNEGDAFDVTERSQAVGGQSIDVRGLHASYEDLYLPLFGEAAARNAAAAVAACEALLGRGLNGEAVRQAFSVTPTTGRLEVAGRRPLVVLDGAHNPDAMAALASAIPEAFRWERLHLVVAMFSDKDVEGALARVAPLVDAAYVAPNSSPRAAPVERLGEALRSAGVGQIDSFLSVPDALDAARASADEVDLILVTGSFYTVGDARPLFAGAPSHDERGRT
jgi:dihydrofolate synthase / folylpolyglutamate synthase